MGPLDSVLDLSNNRYSYTFVPNVEDPWAPKVGEMKKIGVTLPISWELLVDKPKEEKMTQTFKVGDKIKLTKDDEVIITTLVQGAWYAGQVLVGSLGGGFPVKSYTDAGWKVEKISPPLPDTPGSVIYVAKDYGHLVLDEDGEWGNASYELDVDDFEAEKISYDIIFDAATVVA